MWDARSNKLSSRLEIRTTLIISTGCPGKECNMSVWHQTLVKAITLVFLQAEKKKKKKEEVSNLPKWASRRSKKKSREQGYGLHFYWLWHCISLEKEVILKVTVLRTAAWRHSVWAWLEQENRLERSWRETALLQHQHKCKDQRDS